MKKEKTKRSYMTWLIPLATLLFVVAVGALWSVPTMQKISAARTNERLAQTRIAQILEPKEQVLTATNQSQVEQMLSTMNSVVPYSAQPSVLIAVLEQVANNSGVTLSRPTFISSENLVPEIARVGIVVKGHQNNVGIFLARVATARPLFKIVELEAQKDTESPENYEIVMEVESPFVEFPDSLGPIDQPIAGIAQQEVDIVEFVNSFSVYTTSAGDEFSPSVPTGKTDPFAN